MVAKTFEVRDAGTFIPILAVKLNPSCEADRYLLARAGYGRDPETQAEYIYVCRLDGGGGTATSDPFEWGGGTRTMQVAHMELTKNFDQYASGAVLDVEFLMGITTTVKQSEAADGY